MNASEAVAALRLQDQAREVEATQSLALKDQIDHKLHIWRAGKEDNLRTLLATLNSILWPELGLEPINMSDLIVVGKVKVKYMKVIAKVHPDKVPFSTLFIWRYFIFRRLII